MTMTNAAPPSDPPAQLFIRVADAARLLGVSKSFAYDMANLWIATNGAEGLPAIRLGRRLLVRRSTLEHWNDEPSLRWSPRPAHRDSSVNVEPSASSH